MNITIEKAKNTIREMLMDRGYTNIEESEKMIKTPDLLVLFSEDEKISINHIKEFVVLLNDEKLESGIFVYPKVITSSAKKSLEVLDKYIELFNLVDLQFNITKHRLVPLHEKLTGDDFKQIKTKYGKNLPILLSTDPISRYYGYKKGDIIKVTRSGSIVAYRVVN